MLRRKMNIVISLLESNKHSEAVSLANTPEYSKAVKALIDTGCVKATRANGGKIVLMDLRDHYSTYQLERHEVWLNRLWGFISGVIITLVAEYLINAAGL